MALRSARRSSSLVALAAASAIFAGAAPAFTPGTVLAATLFGLVDTGELYSSPDAGVTWSPLGAIPLRDAVGLAAGSSATDLLIAGRSGTVYRSMNGGSTWSAVGSVAASDVAGLAIDYDGSVLVLAQTGTLYRSADQGASFTALATLTGSDWVSLARGSLGRLYVLARTGEVAESQDGGATWTTVGAATVSNAVSVRRRGSELFMLTATGEVARSMDYGGTWHTVGAMASSDMAALVDLGGLLVAAAGTGEIATSMNGTTWSWAGAINQLSVTALGTDSPQATGVELSAGTPRFLMRSPYPNPWVGRGDAAFPFALARQDLVGLELYDIAGRLIARRDPEWFPSAGSFKIRWAPEGLAAGTYIVRLRTGSGASASVKWTLAR